MLHGALLVSPILETVLMRHTNQTILLALILLISSIHRSGLSQNTAIQSSFFAQLADSAYSLTKDQVSYDPSYFKIAYPNGDVPKNKGVCTDVVIRAYRKMGIDLQKEVHLDMKANFSAYPKIWGLKSTDTNIDHRRVPNLMVFFSRHGTTLANSQKAEDYAPGDIVCWNLSGAITHIGIVSNIKKLDSNRYLIVHNIGAGQALEDCLFSFKIIGHYRYKK